MKTWWIILGIILMIGLFSFVVYDDRQKQIKEYHEAWDDCDYFFNVNWQEGRNGVNCYSTIAYVIITEYKEIGNYCFVREGSLRDKGEIYGNCKMEMGQTLHNPIGFVE